MKYKLEPQEPALPDRVKMGLVVGDQLMGESGACPSAAGSITNTEACLKTQSGFIGDVYPGWGIDRNRDGKITIDERPGGTTGARVDWKFRIVSQALYRQAITEYNAGLAVFGPLAQEWLSAFRDGFDPGGGISGPDTLNLASNDSGLNHAVGGITSAGKGRIGLSKKITHGQTSNVVKAIMDAPAFYGWIYDTLQIKATEIDALVGTKTGFISVDLNVVSGRDGVGKLTTVRSGSPDVSFGDLYAVLGDAQIFNPTLRLKASRHPLAPSTIVIDEIRFLDSQIEDVFDWDYDVTASAWIFKANFNKIPVLGPMAKAGAMLQAAHGTIGGAGGMVFRNIYILDSNRVFGGRVISVLR